MNTEPDPEPPFGSLTALVPDDKKLGPAMKALTPKARAFVLALVELGGGPMDRAAAAVGYSGTQASLRVTASRLAAEPKVQSAIVEMATSLAAASGLSAVAQVVKIMEDVTANKQVRLNAAARIMAIAGMEPVKNVNVRHEIDLAPSTREQVKEVIQLAREAGIDPRKLLGKAGVELDADFEVVSDITGLEDIL